MYSNLGAIERYLQTNLTEKIRELPKYAMDALSKAGSYVGRINISPNTEHLIGKALCLYSPPATILSSALVVGREPSPGTGGIIFGFDLLAMAEFAIGAKLELRSQRRARCS